jgi:hypothetical protein
MKRTLRRRLISAGVAVALAFGLALPKPTYAAVVLNTVVPISLAAVIPCVPEVACSAVPSTCLSHPRLMRMEASISNHTSNHKELAVRDR